MFYRAQVLEVYDEDGGILADDSAPDLINSERPCEWSDSQEVQENVEDGYDDVYMDDFLTLVE